MRSIKVIDLFVRTINKYRLYIVHFSYMAFCKIIDIKIYKVINFILRWVENFKLNQNA